jgi:hypothetical protein
VKKTRLSGIRSLGCRYRRKTRTQNAYRCIIHGKTACLHLLLTAHFSQDELIAVSAIARATGDVCDHMNVDTPGRFPHHSTVVSQQPLRSF